jgi:Spy/CpxP family protein refolding chaperone
MNSFRTLFPVLGVIAALAGCSAETGANNGVDTANAAQAKTALSNPSTERAGKDGRAFAGRHHGGPDFLVFAALHENIGLSAEQRSTLEGLVAQSRPKEPPQPDKTRSAALATAIRSGKVDASTFQVSVENRDAMMKERVAKSAESLATLHETLTKEQRAALVDAIVAKKATHQRGERGEKGKRPVHAEGREHGPLGHLVAGLDLTQEQQAQLKAKLEADRPARPTEGDREAMKAKFEAIKKTMDAKLQSFKADDFDAKAFVTPPADAPKMGPQDHADRMAKELAIVVSVLTPAQREQLAQKIEQGPPARPPMREGAREAR